MKDNSMQNKKIVLITGASSGIGLATVFYLARNGFRVFAGVRNLEKVEGALTQIKEEGLPVEFLYLDLLDVDSIGGAIDSIMKKEGRIDVLINNAGYGLMGFFEECSMDEIRDQFETNFFSQIYLTKKILPIMRNQKAGRIINISSIYAQYAFPLTSIYAATKFGLEAITDALRIELAPFGIQVATIQPSGIKTNFHKAAIFPKVFDEQSRPYLHIAGAYVKKMKNGDGGNSSPEVVAKEIYRALGSRQMKRCYLVGDKARLLAFLKFILPNKLFENIFKRSFCI